MTTSKAGRRVYREEGGCYLRLSFFSGASPREQETEDRWRRRVGARKEMQNSRVWWVLGEGTLTEAGTGKDPPEEHISAIHFAQHSFL